MSSLIHLNVHSFSWWWCSWLFWLYHVDDNDAQWRVKWFILLLLLFFVLIPVRIILLSSHDYYYFVWMNMNITQINSKISLPQCNLNIIQHSYTMNMKRNRDWKNFLYQFLSLTLILILAIIIMLILISLLLLLSYFFLFSFFTIILMTSFCVFGCFCCYFIAKFLDEKKMLLNGKVEDKERQRSEIIIIEKHLFYLKIMTWKRWRCLRWKGKKDRWEWEWIKREEEEEDEMEWEWIYINTINIDGTVGGLELELGKKSLSWSGKKNFPTHRMWFNEHKLK